MRKFLFGRHQCNSKSAFIIIINLTVVALYRILVFGEREFLFCGCNFSGNAAFP